MWILFILWRKWPRQTLNAVMIWAATIAFSGVIAGSGRLYLRVTGNTHAIPDTWDPRLDLVGFFGGTLLLAAIAIILLERSDRRRAGQPAA